MTYYWANEAEIAAAQMTLSTGIFHQVDGRFDDLQRLNRDGEWTIRNTGRAAQPLDLEAMRNKIIRLGQ